MATATGAGKAATPVADQPSVEALVEKWKRMADDAEARVAALEERLADAALEERLSGADGPSVVSLLARASGEIGAIGKDRKMEEGPAKYAYRSIEAIAERAQPKFAELGLVIVPDRIVELAWVDVESSRGTKGRHWFGRWKWRVYGPAGDFIEIESPGEAADWGDKGSNKAKTASRKNALVDALNLAENALDPDTYAQQDVPAARTSQTHYAGSDWWLSWKDARDALRGGAPDEWAQFTKWCADNSFDLRAINKGEQRVTLGQGMAIEEKARELLAAVMHASQEDVDGYPKSSAPQNPTYGEQPVPTSDELRDRIATMEGRPAGAAETPQDGQQPVAAATTPEAAPEASEAATAPRGYWPCNRCGEVADGRLGQPCPVCKKGELFDGRLDAEEPF